MEKNRYPEIWVRLHSEVNFEISNDFVFPEGKKGKMFVITVVEQSFKIVQCKNG